MASSLASVMKSERMRRPSSTRFVNRLVIPRLPTLLVRSAFKASIRAECLGSGASKIQVAARVCGRWRRCDWGVQDMGTDWQRGARLAYACQKWKWE